MSLLINTAQRALVLHLSAPDLDKVVGAVPTAGVFEHKGKRLVAVPHKLDEVRVLRNLGYQVPSPIGYHYEWPGRYKPFRHQSETAGFLTLNQRAFVLNEIGTGKTIATLWAADFLMRERVIRRALIVSPLSTLRRVWDDEIFTHFRGRSSCVLHGTAERRRKMFKQNHDFYIINHDGLEVLGDLIGKRDDIDLIIVDEIAVYRNAKTEKWKFLKANIRPQQWVWGLTGTPIPNEPTDSWAQCQLLVPSRVPKYPTTFKNMVMTQLGPYRWAPRKEALGIVYNAMQPAIRFERDKCLDLPDCIYSERQVEMSDEQKHHYKLIHDKLFTQLTGGQVNAVNEGVKLMKLVQAACGVLYDNDGRTHLLDCKARVALVKEIIVEAGQKVIVFAPFTSVVKMLHAELAKHWTCEIIYGQTPPVQRDQIFYNFQKTPNPHVLVADAGCMSHGLTLTEASTIVWYAPTTSNDEYNQANGRITRQGQKYVANIVHIEGSKIERKIYARLKEKSKLQGVLLEMVEEGLGQVEEMA